MITNLHLGFLYHGFAYFILFLIAFAGPSIGNSFKEVKEEGKDIFIAVDLSQSMVATDVAPNRLRRIQLRLYRE